MRKFNLEEARAGLPVCTRDGDPAKITNFNTKLPTPHRSAYVLTTEINGDTWYALEDGRFLETDYNHPYDLMMTE